MKLSVLFLILLLSSSNTFSQIKKELKPVQPTPDCCGFPNNPLIIFNPVSQTICAGSNVSYGITAAPAAYALLVAGMTPVTVTYTLSDNP